MKEPASLTNDGLYYEHCLLEPIGIILEFKLYFSKPLL